MARWHERPERQEVLSGWAKKSAKRKTQTLEGMSSLYTVDGSVKPGKEPKGITPRCDKTMDMLGKADKVGEAGKTEKPKRAYNLRPTATRPPGRPKKPIDPNAPPKVKKSYNKPTGRRAKDPFHERYEQHVVVAYSRKRGLPFYAIPNGARRTLWEAIEAKKSGMASGVPDLCYPVPMGKFGGLYIEMKRRTGGVISPMQKYWFAVLREGGYRVEVAEGADQAILILDDYFQSYGGLSNDTLALLQIAIDSKRDAQQRKSLLPVRRVRKAVPDHEHGSDIGCNGVEPGSVE